MGEPSGPAPDRRVPFIVRFLATGFFSGYSPVASGTAGSLVALALYAIPWVRASGTLPIATAAAVVVGVYVSGIMERRYGEDPSIVVIDEIAGMWISLLFITPSIAAAMLAFLLFRLFDIFKPPPARQLERLHGGWGIMLDDVAAGVYANVAVRIILIAFSFLKGAG